MLWFILQSVALHCHNSAVTLAQESPTLVDQCVAPVYPSVSDIKHLHVLWLCFKWDRFLSADNHFVVFVSFWDSQFYSVHWQHCTWVWMLNNISFWWYLQVTLTLDLQPWLSNSVEVYVCARCVCLVGNKILVGCVFPTEATLGGIIQCLSLDYRRKEYQTCRFPFLWCVYK